MSCYRIPVTTTKYLAKYRCVSGKSFYCIGKTLRIEEPSPLVTVEPIMNPAEVAVPYLREQQREDIYVSYKADPVTWSPAKLAEKYNASEMRIKAVIYLMQKREELMEKNKVINIPQDHQEIYEKSLNKENTIASIAEVHQKSEEEVKDIIARLTDHHQRLANMKAMEGYNNDVMKEFTELGASTDFRETPSIASKSIASDYFPKLFGDTEFEQTKNALLKRILSETKAKLKPHPGFLFLKEKFGDDVPVENDPKKIEELIEKASWKKFDSAKSDGAIESRFKFAIRDISVPESLRKTVIRTRSGK